MYHFYFFVRKKNWTRFQGHNPAVQFFLLCNKLFFLVRNKQSSTKYASIAQLAEHLLRKEKVTSSILVGGWQFAWSSWL